MNEPNEKVATDEGAGTDQGGAEERGRLEIEVPSRVRAGIEPVCQCLCTCQSFCRRCIWCHT